MLTRPLILAALAAALVLGAACTDDSDEPDPTDTGTPDGTAAATLDPVTEAALRKATLPTDPLPAGEVVLEDGAYSEPAAPGSASMVEFNVEMTVIDDLNEDGVDDGAMVVRSSAGGSGTFYALHVFLASEGGPELIASQDLGDRIAVRGIAAGPGGVTVEYLARADGEPMTAEPTVPSAATIEVRSDGSTAVSVSQSIAEPEPTVTATPAETPDVTTDPASGGDACADLAPEAYDAAFTFVTNLRSGDTLESGTTVEGCSRTFESNVPWRLLDREGNVIAEDFTMGGGVDGPAPFAFTVEYEVEAPQVGHLFVGGDDPSGGEGPPPVLNQIPVVLLP